MNLNNIISSILLLAMGSVAIAAPLPISAPKSCELEIQNDANVHYRLDVKVNSRMAKQLATGKGKATHMLPCGNTYFLSTTTCDKGVCALPIKVIINLTENQTIKVSM